MTANDKILLKQLPNSGEVPTPVSLSEGELAVNPVDRKIYSKDNNGIVYDVLNQNTGQSLYFSSIKTTGISEVALNVFDGTLVNSAIFVIEISDGTNLHFLTLNLVHDHVQIFTTIHSVIKTGSPLATFTTSFTTSGNFVQLKITPTVSSTTVKFSRLDITSSTSQDKSVDFMASSTSGTSPQVIDTFDKTLYNSAEYQIEISDGIAFDFINYIVIHNGISVSTIQPSILSTGSSTIGILSSVINNNNVELKYTPTSAVVTTIKIARFILKI